MATLVLTALGSAFGGPVGGAIGAFLGQQADSAIFGSGPRREGPRLKELEVQTSSYGTEIPAIYGAMRVAGTVIWASDLIEQRSVSGGSKGRPGTVMYSYSVNLAVAVSSKSIVRIGRVWADGNLLRGASGDLKVETELRVYYGHEDQLVDPLLYASESAGTSPAYRGIAYVVFEGLQLADFGNRIPSFTFEIFEREGAVALHQLLNEASEGLIQGATPETVDGYALQGQDLRSSIAPLVSSFPVTLRPMKQAMVLESWFDGPSVALPGNSVTRIDGKAVDRPAQTHLAKGKSASAFALRHYEPERDYQAGLQRFGASQGDRRDQQFDLPASLTAAKARRLAALQWLQQSASRVQRSEVQAFNMNPPKLGQRTGEGGSKVTEIGYLDGCIRISSAGWTVLDTLPASPADPGRDIATPDMAAGQTLLQIVDLPALAEPLPTQPSIGVVAAGTGEGWRRAALSRGEGVALVDIGRTAAPANFGFLQAPLPPHPVYLIDYANRPLVRAAHAGMSFPAGSGDALSINAPLIHISGEYIKYATCEQVGPTDYRLSGIIRGCFGTEGAMAMHAIGTPLTLITPEDVARFDALGLPVGATATIEAIGVGDVLPVEATLEDVGLAVRPLSPTHLNIVRDQSQNLNLSWVRRSRLDGGWRDYGDLQLDEPRLTFEMRIEQAGILLAVFETQSESLQIAAEVINGWGRPAGTLLTCLVRQVGQHAISVPCTRVFTV